MSKKTQLLSTFTLTFLVIGGLWYFFARGGERGGAEREASVWQIAGAPPLIKGEVENSGLENWKLEINEKYGFSFQYPADFTIVSSPYGDLGEIIVFEPSEASSEGWQIFIIPFDEPNSLTSERIRVDLPDIVMNNIRQATLAGAPALVFDGENEAIGATYEIWFARNRYLYQIMTYKGFENEMNIILQTWKFE